MTRLYPLRFHPVLRRYLWGGRRLGTELGKPIGEGNDYAESWEVVDHGRDQSIVADGPLAGTTLAELVANHGSELIGRHYPLAPGESPGASARFPLLFKFLDAHDRLSVQVHPNDEQAARLDPPDFGKSEAWVVLAADPGSFIYAGVKRGFDTAALAREIARGTCELCLHRIEPRPGDCLFLPAGMIHALGPGLLIAEIQQSSDITYRLFDWNREGSGGKPRELHVEAGLAVIDLQLGPAQIQQPAVTDRPHVERLVACDKFVLDRWRIVTGEFAGGDNRCHIVAVLSGEVAVAGDLAGSPLTCGGVVVLPASLGRVELRPTGDVELLDIYLP